MQFYPKVLPSFTHANIGKRWVKSGKTFYPPSPGNISANKNNELICMQQAAFEVKILDITSLKTAFLENEQKRAAKLNTRE